MSPEAKQPRPRWQRYGGAVVGVLVAFGIFGAIGSNIVDRIFDDTVERLTGVDALRANVRRDPYQGSDGFTVATKTAQSVEGKLDQVKDCAGLYQSAKEAGAVDVGRLVSNVMLEGTTHRGVAIVDIRAEIVDRGPLLAGAMVHCQPAGSVGSIGLSLDFDEANPLARRVSEGEDDGDPYFERGDTITLEKGEMEPLQVTATISQGYVEWNLAIDVLVDGAEETIVIDDEDGRPFQLTAGPEGLAYDYYYDLLWGEQPPRLYASSQPPEY